MCCVHVCRVHAKDDVDQMLHMTAAIMPQVVRRHSAVSLALLANSACVVQAKDDLHQMLHMTAAIMPDDVRGASGVPLAVLADCVQDERILAIVHEGATAVGTLIPFAYCLLPLTFCLLPFAHACDFGSCM